MMWQCSTCEAYEHALSRTATITQTGLKGLDESARVDCIHIRVLYPWDPNSGAFQPHQRWRMQL